MVAKWGGVVAINAPHIHRNFCSVKEILCQQEPSNRAVLGLKPLLKTEVM